MTPSSLRILLLEDTDSDALRIQMLLKQSPFSLTRVTSVAAAVQHLSDGMTEFLIIDLCVDDSEGIATFQKIHKAAPHIPIIVQSGLEEDTVGPQAVRLGAQDFLVKGKFNQDQLLRTIRYAQERKAAEHALRESKERYAIAVSGAKDVLWDWDLRSNELYISHRWSELLQIGEATLSGTPEIWFNHIHPEDVDHLMGAIHAHLDQLTGHLENEHRVLNAQGECRWMLVRGMALRDTDERAYRMAGSITDITDRKQIEVQLRHDALHDHLTDLANRTLCLERISQAMRRSKRTEHYLFAFLFIDLDRFKLVNDSLGHGSGNGLLIAISNRINSNIRSMDTLARFSGDEFGLLLEDLQNIDDARLMAERIRELLSQPFHVSGKEIYITASIGIAQGRSSYRSPEEMVRDADLAMYQAKKLGKDCYAICDTRMHVRARQRLELETNLRRAIEHGEFSLHYQPIIDLHSGKVHSHEALIRWKGADGKLIWPDRFIGIAEDTGLIVPIGLWVIREAVTALQQWSPTGNSTVSVNLSPRQFLQPDIVPSIARILKEVGLAPQRLSIEITEGVFIDYSAKASRVFADLKRLGVTIHLDDFGTGYSSLGYLRRFPVDCLKIDRSFVKGLPNESDNLAIIRAILALSQAMNIAVIAEGIETKEQLSLMQGLRCAFGQGYLFARPCEDPDILKLKMYDVDPSTDSATG